MRALRCSHGGSSYADVFYAIREPIDHAILGAIICGMYRMMTRRRV